ncbi:carboxymuconolactone decarboxylase [Caballeronia hypogeia]|uniref:Carboxymuconolactone decarboxylase n=1 Tax=Caballeronia hypogeia TaxID=1777140 RepID=A0A158CLW1_9BURK|nr:carboxymuconolactone decarboxylase family protein [Caballeronia hypogeia]SAK82507.1 carboxymuconolactone decarboxylase [Caballeronia hypogeia]
MMDIAQFDKGTETRLSVFGPDYAQAQAAKTDEFSRVMRDFGIEYNWASIWSRPNLDYKTRGFLNIATLTALKLPNQLADHVRGALKNGATPIEIREVLLQSAAYVGVAAGAAAFGVALTVVTEAGLQNQMPSESEPTYGPGELLAYGHKVREEVFGSEHVRNTATDDPFTKESRQQQIAYIFGAIWGRGVLDYKTRSLLNVATMIALGRAPELELYMKSAVRHGATADEIKEVLLQASVYAGVAAGAEGFRVAKKVLADATA